MLKLEQTEVAPFEYVHYSPKEVFHFCLVVSVLLPFRT